MRKINFQECPICEKEILSDATTKSYCRLCGMNIDNLKKDFCCPNCKNKFNEFIGY